MHRKQKSNAALLAAVFGLLFFGCVESASAKAAYFPHYADGGGWTFRIAVSNLSPKAAKGKIYFFDGAGLPQTVSLNSGPASSLDLDLPPSSTYIGVSEGTGEQTLTGYAVADLDQNEITGLLTFCYRNRVEVSVLPQSAGQKFTALVEKNADLDCGIAVAFQTSPQPLSLKLIDTEGTLKIEKLWNPGRMQDAKYMFELFEELNDFKGLMVLESGAYFSCMALRLGLRDVNLMSAIPVYDSRLIANPTVLISSPTAGPEITIQTDSISLSGTAIGTTGIQSVTWFNRRGGSGTASGKASWSIPDIHLQIGSNVITVQAGDAEGNMSSDVLTVYYVPPSAVAYQLPGINFSPYLDGQDPNRQTQIPESQIRSRMDVVAPYVRCIRSFGSVDGLEKTGQIAKGLDLCSAVGIWLSADPAMNERQIANALAVANAGNADSVIVGSEVLLRGDLSEEALIGYMNRVKAAIPSGIPVSTADTYGVLLNHPKLMQASDVILANFYPYWEGISVNSAVAAINNQYEQLKAAVPGKTVFVSETGWPDCGEIIGNAVPSPDNAAFFFLNFVSWARAKNVPYFYFEAFDESWKTKYEGPQGACWGIWDKEGSLKTGMQAVFDGQMMPDNWSGAAIPGGPGDPFISLTFVPPKNTIENLRGVAMHVDPSQYKVAVYIGFNGTNWWIKPYSAEPLTLINADGSWICDITTGGMDEEATDIVAYLLPADSQPLIALGNPSISSMDSIAVAKVTISR